MPEGRCSTNEEEGKTVSKEGKTVSTWLVVTSGDSRSELSGATGALILEEAAFFFKRKAARLCRSLSMVALDFFLGPRAAGNGNQIT